ncbi:HAD family hydrolase [Oscillatoria sp. CS-180]|uniref:HAD family hydrolase n=1 Tax=Oscillatoria sp. CS-180 TaxID=3021720 RepID=UPI00232F3771|nr:HAD family hydrolase [Oscillatoria sp. CS-180]MDB9525682.1 HAD family hydrolase [Oscillatoria sp. CS-180]
MAAPGILALDFDGVLCDGLVEYFQTAWKAYCQLFLDREKAPPDGLAEQFYPLRPVIETGWEMPLLLHALQQGVQDTAVLDHWQSIVQDILQETGVNPDEAMTAVDGTRDRWIKEDLQGWLSLHRFYPGVIERLQQAIASDVFPLIISTKEGRFIHALLAQEGIDLPRERIIGKENKQSKSVTLRQLQQSPPAEASRKQPIWFVEDRLKTLTKVKAEANLQDITLFLVDWGYNTTAEKDSAASDPRIHLLSLSQLVRGFSEWLSIP